MRVLERLEGWLLMAVEVLRKLVGGAWKTVVEEAGGGGGSQPFVLLGPWTVTYADIVGLNPVTQGFLLHSFPAGAIVLDVWSILMTQWNSVDARLQISLVDPVTGDYLPLYFSTPGLTVDPRGATNPVDGTYQSNGFDAVQNQAFNSGDGLNIPSRLRANGADLVATLDDHTGTATAGSLDVYALAYVPT